MKSSPLYLKIFKSNLHKELIHFGWEIKNNDTKQHPQAIFPALCFDIIFPLNGYLVVDGDRLTQPFVSPILSIPKNIIIGEYTHLIGIRFLSTSFKPSTEIHPDRLKQTYNFLKEFISNSRYRRIKEIIQSDKSTITLLNSLLKVLVLHSDQFSDKKSRIVSQGIRLIKSDPESKISALSLKMGISERWLEMIFNEFLGQSPRTISKIITFNKAISLIYETDNERLTDISLRAGYFDQSHFIREFRKNTGLKPGEFVKNRSVFYEVMNGYM